MDRVLVFSVVLVLILGLAGLPVAADSELRIKVLENKEFRINGNEVHIVGKIEITKGDLFLTAGEIVYNSEEKTAVITGEPYLKTKDAEVDGQRIEADFEEDVFTFTGSVRVQQAERVALANEVHVDNAKHIYLLFGNVLVTEKKDDKELRAEEVLIDSESDTIEVKGPVELSFILAKDQEETPEETDAQEGTAGEPKAEAKEEPPPQTTADEVYVQVEDVSTRPLSAAEEGSSTELY
ncbi:MAG: hypothetical protein H0Z38_02725 [Firmicutes bacterium]|nr:hypothetical protein [Bacillota bacterium]